MTKHRIDTDAMRKYIRDNGVKQGYIARRAGLTDAKISLLLSGKQKMNVDEYYDLCSAMGVKPGMFLTEQTQQAM